LQPIPFAFGRVTEVETVTFRALRADPVSEFPDASSTVVIRFSTASSMRCKRGRRGLPSTFFGISVGTALTLAGILTQELDDDAHAVFVAHATWCHATPTLARAAVAPRTAADRRSRKRTRATLLCVVKGVDAEVLADQ
jgi:hypothetical protein